MAAAKNILMVFTSNDKLGEHDEQVRCLFLSPSSFERRIQGTIHVCGKSIPEGYISSAWEQLGAPLQPVCGINAITCSLVADWLVFA